MTQPYRNRLSIGVEGDAQLQLYTCSGWPFSVGYLRVVIGARGPYIEFARTQIIMALTKSDREHYYYSELTSEEDAVKVYDQLHTVRYADYKIGRLYASPFFLYKADGMCTIRQKETDGQLRLFDQNEQSK